LKGHRDSLCPFHLRLVNRIGECLIMSNTTQSKEMELVIKIAHEVRTALEEKYEWLGGRCIEASDTIVDRLTVHGIKGKAVEGWCVYDFFETCTNRPYDEHTWVEATIEGKIVCIDITATQFEPYIDAFIPKVIIGEKPYFLQHTEPDEAQLDEMGW